MKKFGLRAPSPALLISVIALFVALGGTTYAAAVALPVNSVGTPQIKNLAVTGPKIANGGVTAAKINPAGLTVPNATTAANALALGGKAPSSFANVGSDAFTAPTLNDDGYSSGAACHWTNYGNGQQDAGYFRDAFGIVHLKGFVVAHEGSAIPCGDGPPQMIFNLPAGYRPAGQWAEYSISNNQPGRININPTGNVEIEGGSTSWTNAHVYVSLDGLTFRCAPSGANGCP